MNCKHVLPLFFLFLFLGASTLPAQDFKKRFSFAKAYFGLDLNYVPTYGESVFLGNGGAISNFTRNGFVMPAVNFGATHFWGHADFYVSINTAPLGGGDQPVATTTRLGAFTGLRLYPWKSTVNTLRPFVGYKFSPIRYRQETLNGQSFGRTSVRGVLDLGLTYQTKSAYFYLGYNRLLNDELTVPIDRSSFTQTTFPSGFLSLGANWAIETTYNADQEGTAHFNKTFAEAPRFGWFLAIGPSSVFPLAKSDYFTEDRAFLDDLVMSNILPDLAAGFHFLPLDANLTLSYRPIVQERSGGGLTQTVRRNSLVLETYKYLGDYHGFAPYLGVGLGYERLRLTEEEGETMLADERENTIAPVLVFGWDIRPSRKGDAWLLRTNLRYTPSLKLTHRNRELNLQQLEFNFIQLVVFPARLRAYRQYY